MAIFPLIGCDENPLACAAGLYWMIDRNIVAFGMPLNDSLNLGRWNRPYLIGQ